MGSDSSENSQFSSLVSMDGARELLQRNLTRIQGEEAEARAQAWALSPPGTPYGGTEAVPAAPRSGAVPLALDQRVIARMRGGDACG